MTQPPDYAARQQALDPEQSFICEAPAGSGKTELLTQRFLTLLGRVKKPEEILAITFTRKATGEMRERILAALRMALGERPNEAHRQTTWALARGVLDADRRYQWQLLRNPNRLQIKTFDSLCASLAKNLPLESTFGAMPQVAEDAEELYRKAVRALLGSLESDSSWNEALVQVLQLLDNHFGRFEALMMALLGIRDQWLPLIAHGADRDQIRKALEQALQNILRDTVATAHELIPAHLHRDIVYLAAFAAANLRTAGVDTPLSHCQDMDCDNDSLPGWSAVDINRWQGIVSLFKTLKGEWRKTINKNSGFPPGSNRDEKAAFAERKQQLLTIIDSLKEMPGVSDALDNLRSLPKRKLEEDQWQVLAALFTLLPVLTAQLTVVFRETNSIDFIELSLGAQRALGSFDEPSQLALKLDYRLNHILVDEFQDTSANQIDLLNRLTAGWMPDDGRTLFCVGDAMQSIYGFRGANVGLFLNCREQGLAHIPLQPIRLTANFRSQAGIVHWVNGIFKSAFPQQDDVSTGAVCYAPSTSVKKQSADSAVWVHGFVDHDDATAEGHRVVEIVRQVQQQMPDASIAILVRNRTHVDHIVPLLQQARLRYRAVDLESLQEHPVVQDLMALTRALLHLADRTAWLAVLRAPWCGLSLQDLQVIANMRMQERADLPTLLEQCQMALHDQHQEPQHNNGVLATSSNGDADSRASALTIDGERRLRRALSSLLAAQQQRERKSLRDWIEGCWLALGGPACVADAVALENAAVFFTQLESWEYASDLPSFAALEKAVSKLYASADPQASEQLQIMTIHKSKGLEFDVVIVPQLQRKPRNNSSSLLMWHERINTQGQAELIMVPLTEKENGQLDATYAHLRNEENRKSAYENCRLLYVACTRAKRQLHLCAQLKEDKKDKKGEKALVGPVATSLLAAIWEPVQIHIKRIYPESIRAVLSGEDKPVEPLSKTYYRLADHWQYPELISDNILGAYIPPYQFAADDNTIGTLMAPQLPRQLGTLVHQYLQIIAEQGVAAWQNSDRLPHAIRAALRSAGVTPLDLDGAVTLVANSIQSILQDVRGHWILDNRHPFAACEYPLTLNGKNTQIDVVLDRIITDAEGITWIIDYKIAEPEGDQAMDIFLQEQKERYAEQLALYRQAAEQAGFSPVKTALYFPLIMQWLELEPVSGS